MQHFRFCDHILKVVALLTFVFASPFLMAWTPTGGQNLMVDPSCRSEVLARQIVNNFSSSSIENYDEESWINLEKIVQSFFERCEEELYRSSLSKMVDYLEMQLVNYDIKQHPNVQEVEFLLPGDEIVVRGLLALQDTTEKRPLVIYKCGLSCDLYHPSMLYVLMVFFDIGPFNVLLLPSNSGETFVEENKIFAIGGLEEGRQIAKIAEFIDSGSWKFSNRFSRIHLFGKSLGGHAAMYASLYADYMPRPSAAPLFSSVFVGCPVVDFKASLDHVISDTPIARVMRRTVLSNVMELLFHVPFFGRLLEGEDRTKRPTQTELRKIFLAGVVDFYKGKTEQISWRMPPLEGLKFTSPEKIWEWLNFSKGPVNLAKNPVYVWAPQNDDVVLFKDNAKKLYESDRLLTERKIFSLNTKRGGHCAFPAAFGWGASTAVLNAFYIARSPELVASTRTTLKPLHRSKFQRTGRASVRKWRTDVTWLAKANEPFVSVRSLFREVPCRMSSRSGQRCLSTHYQKFSYDEIGMSNSQIPKTTVEAEAFSRRLNSRLRLVVGSDGNSLRKDNNPSHIRILKFSSDD